MANLVKNSSADENGVHNRRHYQHDRRTVQLCPRWAPFSNPESVALVVKTHDCRTRVSQAGPLEVSHQTSGRDTLNDATSSGECCCTWLHRPGWQTRIPMCRHPTRIVRDLPRRPPGASGLGRAQPSCEPATKASRFCGYCCDFSSGPRTFANTSACRVNPRSFGCEPSVVPSPSSPSRCAPGIS